MILQAVLLLSGGSSVGAQIADQVIVYANNNGIYEIERFDRMLNHVGSTRVSGVGGATGGLSTLTGMDVDAKGTYWVPFDSFWDTKVLRMEKEGSVSLPHINLQHNSTWIATAASGTVYSLTRIPLLTTGPLYAMSSTGQVLWSNPQIAPLFYFPPYDMVITPTGEIWIGGEGPVPLNFYLPQLVRVDPADGHVLQMKKYPKPAGYVGPSVGLAALTAAPDGTLWAYFSGSNLTHISGLTIDKQVQTVGVYGDRMRVDAAGNLIVVAVDDPLIETGKFWYYDAETLTLTKEFVTGGIVSHYALGASGEDLYAMFGLPPTWTHRLLRLNLVTGVKSSISLAPWGTETDLPLGDPTGFIWANVTDQQGDSDSDGATNRVETLAGSNPYDATSRPEGPKVYLSFAPTTNSIRLTWKDPDGLLDPAGGLDLQSIELIAGGYGEVMPYLWPFLTTVDFSVDGKEATIELGALSLPPDMKVPLEARVADKTGATAWDWQVTPPGDL